MIWEVGIALGRCPACYWSAAQWSACNGTCGSAIMTRSVQCLSGGQPAQPGSVACSGACLPGEMPPAVQPCALPTCPIYLWQAGAWSLCKAGSQSRNVGCVDAHGNAASAQASPHLSILINDDCVPWSWVLCLSVIVNFAEGPQMLRAGVGSVQECSQQLGQAPASSRMCGVASCSTDADCSGAGACNYATGTCACRPGSAGATCALSIGPCNSASNSSNSSIPRPLCCPGGITDQQGTCCASGDPHRALRLAAFVSPATAHACREFLSSCVGKGLNISQLKIQPGTVG